jgi:hypothetical protein
MIVEVKFVKQIGDFFSRLFQSRKEKREQDALLLRESYSLLKEMEQSRDLPPSERKDFVDFTNLLLQNAQAMRMRKNKPIARHIRRFAERNCLAGVIPDSELERLRKETIELIERMRIEFGFDASR